MVVAVMLSTLVLLLLLLLPLVLVLSATLAQPRCGRWLLVVLCWVGGGNRHQREWSTCLTMPQCCWLPLPRRRTTQQGQR